jgi:hypothetical protein
LKFKILAIASGLSIILVMMFASAAPVLANAPSWNVSGTWKINVELSGTNYPETLVLTQAGTYITGVSLNSVPPVFSAAFTISSGTVEGNIIIFQAAYDSNLSDIDTFTGTIAINGSMSGTWADTPGFLGRSGTWASTSGQAIPQPPEWNVTGSWNINVELSGTNYPETLVLTQIGADISGVSLNSVPPISSAAFTINSGIVAGNTIIFQAAYDSNPSDIDTFSGTISIDGSMSGTWADNPGFLNRSGMWASASGQASPIEGTGVNGTITGTLTFTQPPTINFGTFTIGTNDVTSSMNVLTNQDWQVTVAGTAPALSGGDSGFLTKYNTTTQVYVPQVTLHNAVELNASGGTLTPDPDPSDPNTPVNNNVTLTGSAQILSVGVAQDQNVNGTSGESRTVDFIQKIVGSDPALATPNIYHNVVSFTCSTSTY